MSPRDIIKVEAVFAEYGVPKEMYPTERYYLDLFAFCSWAGKRAAEIDDLDDLDDITNGELCLSEALDEIAQWE